MKIVYINLDRSPDRNAAFLARNGHLAALERFTGIDGAGIDRLAAEEAGLILNPLGYTNGALGVLASHVELWRRAIEQDEPITIAEDDAVFHRDFERIAETLLADAGAFSFVMWCWNLNGGLAFEFLPGIVPTVLHADEDILRARIDHFPTLPITPSLYPLLEAFGTCAYTISPGTARHLLDTMLPIRNGIVAMPASKRRMQNIGIDVMLNAVYREIRAQVCFPPLVVTPNLRGTSTTVRG